MTNKQKISSVTRPVKQGPLAGVQILDFTRLLPGPLATMFLADLGADVIKIEDPAHPDYVRYYEPCIHGIGAYYLALNRSKRSFAINYFSTEGRKVIYDLVKKADVLVEQFRPGVMNDLGLGYEELSKINPRLIYVAITGYGQHSSMAVEAGHDLNYIAMAGALGITGTENGEPVMPGFQLADVAGGSYMSMNAVMAALYQREKTGKGEFVDVAMTDAVLPFATLAFARHQATKVDPGRGKHELSGGRANYNIYKCRDGKYVALGALEPKFWSNFCTKLGKEDWIEKWMETGKGQQQLKREVAELFLSKPREEWLLFFGNEDVCLTVVNELAELEQDPYLNEREMFLENEHPAVGKYKSINQPLKFKHSKFEGNWCAPDLGADTETILEELNYTKERISELKENNIVKT